MENEEEYISATDINKYTYCPFSLYYEKTYGVEHLRTLKKEYNLANNFTNTSDDNFARGRDYHEKFKIKNSWSILIFIIIVIIAFFYIGVKLW